MPRKKFVPVARVVRGRQFLTMMDVMQLLDMSREEILTLERHLELVPERGPADARNKRDRKYPTESVLRLYYRRVGYSEPNAALFQVRILELFEQAKSDAEIVRELSVPLELVERMRRAGAGPSVQKATTLAQDVERELDEQRASHRRLWAARRVG